MARPVRRILDELDAKPPQIDWAELDATSEDDIERHAAEDGDPPGGYEPRPFPDLKALRARFGMLAARLKTGVPGGIRTHGPRIRNPVLYPAELRGLAG